MIIKRTGKLSYRLGETALYKNKTTTTTTRLSYYYVATLLHVRHYILYSVYTTTYIYCWVVEELISYHIGLAELLYIK